MLQFITNSDSQINVVDQIKGAIAGGCRWIQVNMKDASDDDIKCVINEVKPLCQESESILILSDRVELVKELELDGVHLDKGAMLPTQAREILGAGPIIGVAANSFSDISQIRYFDIDYISVGPYKHPESSTADSPIVSTNDYASIMAQIHEQQIELPIVAFGDIVTTDIQGLWATGINGIAVSNAIANANNISAQTAQFISLLDTPNKIG